MNGDNRALDTANNVLDFRTNAQLRASTSFEEDPDKAARALDQEKAYGVPAQAIMGDPDKFNEMFKRSLGNHIISNNTHLQDFLNSHPVHGALVHDDLGSLDSFTSAFRNASAKLRDPQEAAVKGFREGFGSEGFGSWQESLSPEWQALSRKYPISSQLWTMLGFPFEVGTRTTQGLISGIHGAAASAFGEKFANDLAAMVEQEIIKPQMRVGLGEPRPLEGEVLPPQPKPPEPAGLPKPPTTIEGAATPLDEAAAKASDLFQEAEPFVNGGQIPPVGVAPEFDALHKEMAKAGADAVDDMLKAAQETALRERSPDALEQFIASHGDRTIGIQADAVRELYGSTVPTPEDSKLGFIPNLARQLPLAEAHGGDVEVPLSTWLAKVPPEIAKELKDFIRVRDGGMTVEESKAPPVKDPAPLTLQRTGIIPRPEGPVHEFDIMREGEKVGNVRLQPSADGKDLLVRNITSGPLGEESRMEMLNVFGAAAIRNLAREVMAQFPEAETISGLRVNPVREDRRPVSVRLDKVAGPEPLEREVLVRARGAGTVRSDIFRADRPTQTKALGATEDKVLRLARTYQRVMGDRALAAETGFNTTALSRVMTQDMFRRYGDLIRKEIEEDAKKQEARELKIATRERTKAWKDSKAALEPQVSEEVLNRPEVLAARELRKKSAQAADKDALARAFGYSTGDEMMRANAIFERLRGQIEPRTWERQLIREELNRQMQAKYGDLPEEIIKEAKEHVLRPTVMERIAEEVHAYGMAAGGQVPISKAQLKDIVSQAFSSKPWQAINSDKFMAIAGKNVRKAEEANLKGKHLEAFMHKQQQQIALEMANRALEFEALKQTFDRNLARYARREGPGAVSAPYTHQIQRLLQQVGVAIERSPADLAENIERDGTGTLAEFAKAEQDKLIPLDVADFLINGTGKQLKDMSAEEYMGLATTVKIMDKQGRNAERLLIGAESAKVDDVVNNRMLPLMVRFEKLPLKSSNERSWTDRLGDFPASLLQVETLLRHWDKDDPYGPFQRYIVQRLTNAVNQHSAWEREYGQTLRSVGKIKDPNKLVDNPWFKSPIDGRPIELDRAGLLEVISHWGNESNRDKLLKGGGVISKEGRMEDWVVRQEFERWLVENTTPEDWQRQQAIGKIFGKAFNEILKPVYHRLTGDTPEALDLEPFANAHGKFEGWYHPLNYDSRFNPPRMSVKASGLVSPDFRGQLPANRHAHSRTGYYGPLELNSRLVPMRLNQMLKDGALREAVVDVNKLFHNNGFKNMITSHYGEKYYKDLNDFLQYIVNGDNINEGQFRSAADVMSYMRQAYVSSQINFNLGTAEKHGPTAFVFSLRQTGLDVAKEALGSVRYIYDHREYMKEDKFIRDSSLQMQSRGRTFDEINGSLTNALRQPGVIDTIMRTREYWNHFGTWMVAKSDWFSAKNQWNARYKQAFRETGGDHDQAVLQADAAVRQTHGTTASYSLPAAQRNAGEPSKWFYSLYTFWGTRFQLQARTVYKIAEAQGLVKEGEFKEALKKIPDIAFDAAAYTVFPIIWDLTIATTRPKNWLAAAVVGSLIGSIPFVRDLYHAIETGQEPEGGLVSSFGKDAYRMLSRFTGRTKATASQYLDSFLFALGLGGLGAQGAKSTYRRVTGEGKK